METKLKENDQLLAQYSKPGTYLIVLHLPKDTKCTIGKLGEHLLEKGYYLYVGSALGPGGLAARVKHHLNKSNSPHWHIDYIRLSMRITQLWMDNNSKRQEHQWAGRLHQQIHFNQPLKGFGSSDCKCHSHLFYCCRYPTSATIRNNLPVTIRQISFMR